MNCRWTLEGFGKYQMSTLCKKSGAITKAIPEDMPSKDAIRFPVKNPHMYNSVVPKQETSWFHLPKQNQVLHPAAGGERRHTITMAVTVKTSLLPPAEVHCHPGRESALTELDKEPKERQCPKFGFQKMSGCTLSVFSICLTRMFHFLMHFQAKPAKLQQAWRMEMKENL